MAGGEREREEKQDRWDQRGNGPQGAQGLAGTMEALALALREWTGAAGAGGCFYRYHPVFWAEMNFWLRGMCSDCSLPPARVPSGSRDLVGHRNVNRSEVFLGRRVKGQLDPCPAWQCSRLLCQPGPWHHRDDATV